jgi:two-component sensor histidine kinase
LFSRTKPSSVWSRLLATLSLVVVPAALLTLLLAHSLFASALANLQATQATAASGRAAMLRAWLDSSGRSLANEAAAAALLPSERCALLAKAFLRLNPGFSFLRLHDQDEAACDAGGAPLASTPRTDLSADIGDYRLAAVGDRVWIVSGAGEMASVLVIDDVALRGRLGLAAHGGETHLALIGPGGETLGEDRAAADLRWRPAAFDPEASVAAFRSADRIGETAAFALAPLGSGFRVLLRFDDREYEAAWRRFIVLCLAQLTMLALLAYVYALAIRRDVVRWIEGIDVAAREHARDAESRAAAPVSAKMPRELRNVAESFNTMADRALERQQALQSSLADNRALMLEMHHRIKNSLQVIQSYLALIRRNGPRAEAPLLARIEARVGVLAIAYRLALTPQGMRPISVKPFMDEIFAATTGGLRRPRQRATSHIGWDGELIIDRAIPLGLALVEALVAAFDAPDLNYVGVVLAHNEADWVELSVEADATATGLPEKVMRGLAAQLGATSAPSSPEIILKWRFAL